MPRRDSRTSAAPPRRAPVLTATGRELRQQLLRFDRLDSTLRQAWVATRFKDRKLSRQLAELDAAGVAWLRRVVAEHGWPGRTLVGPAASEAACRLLQHSQCAPSFQRRCLRMLRAAAARGDVPLRQVAYLTDVVLLRAGKKQRYGTKFREVKGVLVPYPLEKPDTVDARRKQMELTSLSLYARKLRQRFPPS
ncbi:hypothetical protein LZ198_00535 [Myxococcus sp. K15C18031901]|uniref:DUF6624 domain-containing protein n=1 Tax=Myxococcus dinghuensis TaxID=2906761 RepID=UPI0020A7CB20|nr:DUF6624 domain-containing protein [Myxococcus dinghuensis]MCP3097351.1 hypothetical protein [Myxococcus dinghuensis]